MARVDVEIPVPDGTSAGTLHVPDGDGPWPGVLLFPDAGGAREVVRLMADRLAGLGYVVLQPDIYYRVQDWGPIDMSTVWTDPEQRAQLGKLMGALTNERVTADAEAYLDFLLARPEVSGTAAGLTGYCMGGRISMLVAAALPDKVAAAAAFHPGRLAVLDDPTSPHLTAGQIRGAVYVGGAKDDASFDEEQVQRFRDALAAGGVESTVEVYDAHHGFAVADLSTYDAAAEERHFAALETLYGTHLKG